MFFQHYLHTYNFTLSNKLLLYISLNISTVLLQRDSQRNNHIYTFIFYANNVINTFVNDKDTSVCIVCDNFYIKYNLIIYDYKDNENKNNIKCLISRVDTIINTPLSCIIYIYIYNAISL